MELRLSAPHEGADVASNVTGSAAIGPPMQFAVSQARIAGKRHLGFTQPKKP